MRPFPDALRLLTSKENPMSKKAPKRRNPVVQAMIARSAKAGRHTDRRKEASRKACRGRVRC